MSKLDLYARPMVMFDPGNKLHRQYFINFVQSGSWKGCPVRFAVEEDHGNLLGHLQRKMILWYAEQERKGKMITTSKPGRKQSMGLTYQRFELTT